jgi:hypothetical protein
MLTVSRTPYAVTIDNSKSLKQKYPIISARLTTAVSYGLDYCSIEHKLE